MSSSLTIEVVEEGTSDLDFLTMTPNFPDFTIDNLPSFSNSIDFSPNPSLLPPISNSFRQETYDNPTNAAYFPNPSSELLTKQQPKRRVTNNQSFDRKTIDLHPTKNLSLSHKKSESYGVSKSVPPQFSPPTEGPIHSVKIPSGVTSTTSLSSQPQRSKLRRLRKPMNNCKKSSSPPTSLPAQTSNLSVDTNTGFDYSQRLKTPSSSSVNSETYPLFPEYSNTSQVDQTIDEDDVFLKEEEITEYCSDRVSYSASAFDSYQLEDMDSQDMFDSFTPIILHSDDPFMDDEEVNNAFLYPQPQTNMDTSMNGIVIPPPLLMTQPNNPSSLPMLHYIPPLTQEDKSIADKSKKSLRRASKNKTSQKPILPSNLRNEVVPSLIRVESKETVQSTASESCESTSQTSIPSRSKFQAIHQSNNGVSHLKPKQPDNPNKQITFCDSGYEMPATKKSTPTPQIQFVSNTPKAPQGISKPCKMSVSSGWKFHNFDREKQPIRDSSGLTYHFYQPKSKIAATTQ